MKRWILGLTGGVGCGKSTVLSLLQQEYEAEIIEADKVAHELMGPGTDCSRAIAQAFGADILTADGAADRRKLGPLVFADREKLLRLNGIVHPAVKREIGRRIAESSSSLIVIEAALLLEEHYEEICDEIWYVYADRETRIRRLAKSRGYSRARSLSVMDSQLTEEEFRAGCQAVLDNSGTPEQTRAALAKLMRERDRRQ